MTPFSKTRIERIAVQAITNEANKFYLIPNIPVGDKGISFDGDIDVMKDDSEKKESLIGKVPVQVKGTYVEEFTEGNRAFSLELAHFKNFYQENGAILFVVEVNGDMETNIFYKQLLPTELGILLKKYESQKTKSVELRALRETNLYRICQIFLSESKKQAPILLEKNSFEQGDYSSFQISSTTFDPMNEGTSNIYEHDFTIYGVVKGLSVPIGFGRFTSEKVNFKETIVFEGKNIEAEMEVTRDSEQITMLIDKSIELNITVTGKFNYRINTFRSAYIMLKLLPLLIAILSGKKVKFVRQDSVIEKVKPKDKEYLTLIEELYQRFVKLKKAFSKFNINENVEFKNENSNFIQEIDSFTALVLENDFSKVNIKKADGVGFMYYDLGGIIITFFFRPTSDAPITNGFSEDLLNSETQIQIDDEFYQFSPFLKLNKELLAYSQNIDFRVLKDSFVQIDPFANESLFIITNQFCLLCIDAYELSQNIELLKLANFIYTKYDRGLGTGSELILRINQLQINKRLNGSLLEEEKGELVRLKLAANDNEQVQFCTSVLLESKVEADWFFNKFDSETQLLYREMPIFRLCNHRC